ncbi:MAG: hypothetical protein ABI036_01545 [Fibrobacteria bacterium]
MRRGMIRNRKNFPSLAAMALGLACQSAFSLGNLHPYFTIKHILPSEMGNVAGIGGIGLLPNGDGAMCTWGGSQQPPGASSKSNGEAWIIPALATGTPGTPTRIATGLREALGVAVVGPDFYVMEKSRITKFMGSGTTWNKSTLWSLPTAWYNDNQWHHFSFNLVTRDSAFWFTTGTAFDYDPNDPLQRGVLIRVPYGGAGFTQLARGLRNANGLVLGPDNEFFVAENQGHWKPTNGLYHIPTKNVPSNGRFFGFRTHLNNSCDTIPPAVAGANCPADPEYPPAIWIPYLPLSNSPTRPILLKEGAYAGQMIGGDVYRGGVIRYFLEKVNGEFQGAVFPMMTGGSGGINFGINQFMYTPTGSLLVIGIGGGTCGLGGSLDWNFNGTCRGLDLLTPTDKVPFEILAIRSIEGGFDVEFTQPAAAAAGAKANWSVKTTVFTPVQMYGGDASNTDNNKTIDVSSSDLSADGKHVKLMLASTLTKRMYTITMSNITSATGETAYANVGYYTLNYVNSDGPDAILPVGAFRKELRATVRQGRISLAVPQGRYRLAVYGLDGSKVADMTAASGNSAATLTTDRLNPGIYLVIGTAEGAAFRQKIRVE